MSRRLIALVALAAILGPVESSLAQEATPQPAVERSKATVLPSGDRVQRELAGSKESATAATTAPTERVATKVAQTPAPVVHYVTYPVLVPSDVGVYCIGAERRSFADLGSAVAFDDEQQFRWMMLSRNYQLCPGVEAPPSRNPAVAAVEYWRVVGEDLLPKPQPRIAPGYMLAGKVGYLEANSPSAAHFEHDTPLGRLVINAHNRVWVDWGDGGGLTGPHDGPGGPWPTGTITHFWTEATTYDVRVVQRWTATWELAGQKGVLAGLATEGLIDDFEVRQLQAVRNS